MLKAVIYTRVSTEEQAENGTSLQTQRSQGLRKAQDLGAEVVEVCEDAGVSGTRYQARPGVQKALTLIEAGAADVLIVSKVDRLARKLKVLLDIAERIDRSRGRIVSGEGLELGGSPIGKLMLGLLGVVAEFEHGIIRERTRAGKRGRAEKGQQPLRARSPYGYHIVLHADVIAGRYGADRVGTVQLREAQAVETVKAAFARYASGESLSGICRSLQAEGVPTPRGAAIWRPPTLLAILRNPVYKGAPEAFGYESVTDESRLARGMKQDRYRRKSTGPKIVLSAPALVSAPIWESVQRRLDEAKAMMGGRPKNRFLLSTFLRCPKCGGGLSGTPRRDRRFHGHDFYGCARCKRSEDVRTYPIESTDAGILTALMTFARSPELIDAAEAAYRLENEQPDPMTIRRQQIDAQLQAIDARERAAVEAQITGIAAGASPAVYTAIFQELRDRRASLQVEREALPQKVEVLPFPRSAAQRAAAAIALMEEGLRSPDVDVVEKRAVISMVVHRIVPTARDTFLVDVLMPGTSTVHTIPMM